MSRFHKRDGGNLVKIPTRVVRCSRDETLRAKNVSAQSGCGKFVPQRKKYPARKNGVLVPVTGVEPVRCRHHRILSYLLHTEHRRTQPPVEVVAGHLKALQILLFLKLMCKKLRFVCHFRSFRFGRKFWILEGHRRDVTHKRSTTAHAIDSSIANTL